MVYATRLRESIPDRGVPPEAGLENGWRGGVCHAGVVKVPRAMPWADLLCPFRARIKCAKPKLTLLASILPRSRFGLVCWLTSAIGHVRLPENCDLLYASRHNCRSSQCAQGPYPFSPARHRCLPSPSLQGCMDSRADRTLLHAAGTAKIHWRSGPFRAENSVGSGCPNI